MSSGQMTFVDLCIKGVVLTEEIDDFVDSWHSSDSEQALHEFLGMTQEEYAAWVDGSWVLPYIIIAHRDGIALDELLNKSRELKLAARAADAERAQELIDWLQEQGKLD